MTEMQAVYGSLQINPAKMANFFRKQFELCNVTHGETIALISDLGTRRAYVMAGLRRRPIWAPTSTKCQVTIFRLYKGGIPTVGQCKGTLEALKAANLIVIFHPPVFSAWVKLFDKLARAF